MSFDDPNYEWVRVNDGDWEIAPKRGPIVTVTSPPCKGYSTPVTRRPSRLRRIIAAMGTLLTRWRRQDSGDSNFLLTIAYWRRRWDRGDSNFPVHNYLQSTKGAKR